MQASRGKLIFDDRCGFCQKAVGLLRNLDWFGTIEFIPLGQAGGLMSQHSISAEATDAAMHYISPLGQVTAGAEAFHAFGKRIPVLLPLTILLHLPFVLHLAKRVYQQVANNRQRLSRVLRCDSGRCSAHRDR